MVLLEHGRVIQPHAVVDAAAAAHRVFLQQTKPRGGLAGVGQTHTGALKLGHQCSGGGGNAREAHGQVQGGAFPSHQSLGRPLQLQQAVPDLNGVAVLPQQAKAHPGIQTLEQALHQRTTTEPARLFGDPMGLTLLALQGSRRQITAADVFRQPGLQGSGECRGLPVQTVSDVR